MSFAPGHLRHARRFASALALFAVAATPAAAQTVTFETLATTDPVRYVQNGVTVQGLTFTAVGAGIGAADAFAVNGPSQAAVFTGSAALFNNLTATTAITAGGPFSVMSLSATSGLGLFSFQPTMVTFTGFLNAGGSVTQMATLAAGTVTPMPIMLSGFTNLSSLQVTVTSPGFETVQLDNIVFSSSVAVVPEPSTVLLLGSGLVGVAAFARRRRRQGTSA